MRAGEEMLGEIKSKEDFPDDNLKLAELSGIKNKRVLQTKEYSITHISPQYNSKQLNANNSMKPSTSKVENRNFAGNAGFE